MESNMQEKDSIKKLREKLKKDLDWTLQDREGRFWILFNKHQIQSSWPLQSRITKLKTLFF